MPARVRVPGLARWGAAMLGLVSAACTAGPDDPSKGTYTVDFPSTAAAVATDAVQLLVFDVPSPDVRSHLCQDLLQARQRREALRPVVENPPVPTCALLAGAEANAVSVPYGEHAVLAVGIRGGADFLLGCGLQTFGEGDAVQPIQLSLADPTVGVPITSCTSVSEFCSQKCPAN